MRSAVILEDFTYLVKQYHKSLSLSLLSLSIINYHYLFFSLNSLLQFLLMKVWIDFICSIPEWPLRLTEILLILPLVSLPCFFQLVSGLLLFYFRCFEPTSFRLCLILFFCSSSCSVGWYLLFHFCFYFVHLLQLLWFQFFYFNFCLLPLIFPAYLLMYFSIELLNLFSLTLIFFSLSFRFIY